MSLHRVTGGIWVCMLLLFALPAGAEDGAGRSPRPTRGGETWQEMMAQARAAFNAPGVADKPALRKDLLAQMERRFPVAWDWSLQDLGADVGGWLEANRDASVERKMLERVLAETGASAAGLRAELDALAKASAPAGDPRWLYLYLKACERRRAERLRPLLAKWRSFVFAKHFNMGASHYAYTEGQSDAQAERHFYPGTALCVLEMEGLYGRTRTLIEDAKGVIRNPDVSHDGRRILFAWKKSDREDDYHLYDLDVATGKTRQLTEGLGFADYEGAYLPNGDIVFNSTRCVQTVDCWWTEVSNLYTCDANGRFLRRLGFDQVHTNFPAVLPDGRVVYTRWDYNDRGQIYPQPLFQMLADGTAQMEYYGNSSWFPTTIIHARGIPGSEKLVAIATGHHSFQAGKLILIDPSKGRQENSGVQLIAPMRPTPAERIDAYGQQGDLFQYPYALNEREFLATYHPLGWVHRDRRFREPRFGIYWMAVDGRRELLVADADLSCNQPIPLAPRPRGHVRPSGVDYRKETGTYYLQDIYAGPGLAGVERGTVKRLRVVGLEYRAAGVGSNGNAGPGGGALVSTPIAVGNGCWDVKVVLGETPVYPDGSACFQVPARMPLYFQALDKKGRAVQTMRTWSTLQPGETASCVGCHESKAQSALAGLKNTLAMRVGAQPLEPFYGPARGFSFAREVQPILDKHCVACHSDRGQGLPTRSAEEDLDPATTTWLLPKESAWQYTTEDPGPGWEQPGFDASGWKTGQAGFGRKGTPGGKVVTEWHTKEIWLRGTLDLPVDWESRRLRFVYCHDEDVEVTLNGVLAASAAGYITAYRTAGVEPKALKALKPGKNTIAVHCTQTIGGQFIDVAVAAVAAPVAPAAAGPKRAFSLLGAEVIDPAAKRRWSDAYLNLTNSVRTDKGFYSGRPNHLVNWVTAQSVPSMLPPRSAGSTKSALLTMLEEGHHGVKLSRAELEKLACWIDLGVPFCGDYVEANAWSDAEKAKYGHFLDKRRRMEALEAENIRALLSSQ